MVMHCKICHKQFAYQHQLADHSRSHTGEKPFKCNECAAVFRSKGLLRGHAVCHLSDRQLFQCMLCHYRTYTYERLEHHAAVHKSEPRFVKSTPGIDNSQPLPPKLLQCSRCLAKFHRSGDVISHLISHTGVKPFKCDVCYEEFSWRATLANHRRRFHGDTSNAIRCEICSNTFAVRAHLTAHTQTVHQRQKRYTCDVCPRRFSTPAAARQHRQAHRGERFIKCDRCPKAFLCTTQLRLHVAWAHEGMRPFKCSACYKGFHQKAHWLPTCFSYMSV